MIVVEYHDGAGSGTPDGATLEQEVAAGGAFAKIVNEDDRGGRRHLHRPHPQGVRVGRPGAAAATGKTRPIVQTGSYGENIGQIKLTVDTETRHVTGYKARNVKRTTDPAADLVAAYPRVAAVKTIVRQGRSPTRP